LRFRFGPWFVKEKAKILCAGLDADVQANADAAWFRVWDLGFMTLGATAPVLVVVCKVSQCGSRAG
jgi:hypothetical protein